MPRALLSAFLLLCLACHGAEARPGRASLDHLRDATVPASAPVPAPETATAPSPDFSSVPSPVLAAVPTPAIAAVPSSGTATAPSGDHWGPAPAIYNPPAGAPSPGQGQNSFPLTWPGLGDKVKAGRLEYHQGPLMTAPIKVYVIYYGNWPENSGQSVLEGFVNSLSSTEADNGATPSVRRWWELATRHTDSNGTAVTSDVSLGKAVSYGADGSYKRHLGDSFNGTSNDIFPIVEELISGNTLPLDSDAFYAVLTSKDVQLGNPTGGFCDAYCGWHNQKNIGNAPVRYALIPDPTTSGCNNCVHHSAFSDTPNGFTTMDSLMSTFAHELAETATNPDTKQGYWALDDQNAGHENGDLCAWTFRDDVHSKTLTDDGRKYEYNMVGVNGLKFLVQALPNLQTQKCALQA